MTGQELLAEIKARFAHLGEIEDMYKMPPKERTQYWAELKQYRDAIAVYNGVREEGIEEGIKEGIEEGKRKVALKLHKMGMDRDTIIECTGVDPDEL